MFRNDWSVDIGVETEDLEKYREGGLCPIHLGDCIADRFTILHKLGHGGFGTVWLVSDSAKRHGRYVALKVVSAAYSEDYEREAVLDQLKKYERDHGNPGAFLVELERLFHTSRHGRHLCQVFPVLGPPLSSLNDATERLYPIFVRGFARQLASGLAAMHSLGVCHGDITMNNLSIRLGKSLDHLTEQELLVMFGRPRTILVDDYFIPKPSPGPQYVVAAADLTLLPVDYLSNKICIMDFDQAFMTDNAPRHVSWTSAPYLAPESIFALTNSPAADVWALGCVLFNLKYPMPLFLDGTGAEGTVREMHHILGKLPEEWVSVQFQDGWPIHDPEGVDLDLRDKPKPITFRENTWRSSLEKLVAAFREPRRPAGGMNPRSGRDFFCLHVPGIDENGDHGGQKDFKSKNTPLIEKEDAKLFADLLRKTFNYDHTKRITASQVLEHPWLQETGQEPGDPRDVVVDPHDTSPLQTNFGQPQDWSSSTSGSEDEDSSSIEDSDLED